MPFVQFTRTLRAWPRGGLGLRSNSSPVETPNNRGQGRPTCPSALPPAGSDGLRVVGRQMERAQAREDATPAPPASRLLAKRGKSFVSRSQCQLGLLSLTSRLSLNFYKGSVWTTDWSAGKAEHVNPEGTLPAPRLPPDLGYSLVKAAPVRLRAPAQRGARAGRPSGAVCRMAE